MARITPSALVDDIKGSVGGVTFSSWKGLSYVKAKAKSVRNPATEAQVQIRNGMTFFSRRFFDDLTDRQRHIWDQYAQEVASAERSDQVQGGFGNRVIPKRQFQRSGYNWFLAMNIRLLKEIGDAHFAAPLDDAPLGQTPPSQPAWTSVTYDPAVGRFSLTFVGPQTLGHATNLKVAIWVLPNWGYAREQMVFDANAPAQLIGPWNMDQIHIQRTAIQLPLPDGIYGFQMDAIGVENGLLSPPSEIRKVRAKFVGP